MSVSGKRISLFALAVLFTAAVLTPLFPNHKAYAAQITNRSLTLQDGATDGASKPSGTVKHLFTFTLPSTASLGSIQFLYCTTAVGTCTAPTGLSVSSVTLGASTGAVFTSVVKPNANTAYVSRTAASYAGGTVTVRLDGAVNPGPTPGSFFTRIATFASTDTTGSPIDTGTVTASTATQITLTGIMPESIIFCTGQTVTAVSGVPDCSTAGTGSISFNQLFSPTDTAIATSQMAASTNGTTGYTITVSGGTLTSGSNTITSMASATTSAKSTGQFGLNLKANTSAAAASFPGTSADVSLASNGTTLKANPATGYGTADTFKFVSGDVIASSDFGGTPGPTDGQIYTASYIVNVPGRQPAGTYVTTLTYTCTATF